VVRPAVRAVHRYTHFGDVDIELLFRVQTVQGSTKRRRIALRERRCKLSLMFSRVSLPFAKVTTSFPHYMVVGKLLPVCLGVGGFLGQGWDAKHLALQLYVGELEVKLRRIRAFHDL